MRVYILILSAHNNIMPSTTVKIPNETSGKFKIILQNGLSFPAGDVNQKILSFVYIID